MNKQLEQGVINLSDIPAGVRLIQDGKLITITLDTRHSARYFFLAVMIFLSAGLFRIFWMFDNWERDLSFWIIIGVFILFSLTIFLWYKTVLMLFRKLEITIDGQDFMIFRGIGSVGNAKVVRLENIRLSNVYVFPENDAKKHNMSVYGLELDKEPEIEGDIIGLQELTNAQHHYLMEVMSVILEAKKQNKKIQLQGFQEDLSEHLI